MSIKKELATLKLIEKSSAVGYFFKRIYYSYFDFSNKYDKNILAIFDVAIQTKKYQFIYELRHKLTRLTVDNRSKRLSQIDKELFLKKLLETFNEQQASTDDAGDVGLRSIKKSINKYIDAHGFDAAYRISRTPVSKINEASVVKKTFTKQDRVKRRRNKALLGVLAFALAFLVAFPEGALAVYGFGLFSLGPVLIFGLSAFAVSYFLYKADLYDFFKNFFYPSKGIKLSPTEGYVLRFLIIFAGLAMGVLLFSSIYIPAGMLIFGFASATALLAAPLTGGLALLIGVSALFAVITALANIALFKPICDKTYLDLKKYFNINSFSDLKTSIKSFNLSNLFSSKTIIVALSAMVMVFGQLWFGSEAYKILHVMIGLSQKTSLISAVVISVLGIINGVFYGKNLYHFLTNSKDFIVNLFKNNKTEQVAVDASSKPNDFLNLHLKRNIISLSRYSVIAVLLVCCIGNATGVATGVAALMGGYILLKKLAFGLVSAASFSANGKASYEAFALPASEPVVNNSNLASKAVEDEILITENKTDKPLATLPKRYTVYFKRKTQQAGGAGQTGFEPMLFPLPAVPTA